MDQNDLPVMWTGLLLLAFIIPAIFFVYAQQKCLQLVRPEHRKMRPVQVWLQLIPLFGLIWQFFVIVRISKSIEDELTARTDDSLFAEQELITARPTYSIGLQYAILVCLGSLPIPGIKAILQIAGCSCWIRYWIQLARYNKILKERAMLLGAGIA